MSIRIAIIAGEGKTIKPEELSTADELQQVVEQARILIRACERLVAAKMPPQPVRRAPYS